MSNVIEENEFSIDETRNTEQAAKGINKNGENFWFWYIRIRKIAGKNRFLRIKKISSKNEVIASRLKGFNFIFSINSFIYSHLI